MRSILKAANKYENRANNRMSYIEILDILLVLIGLLGLIAGLMRVIKLIKRETVLTKQWYLFSLFLCFFIVGYIFFSFWFVFVAFTLQSLLVASIFCGGGIFVYLVMRLFTKTIKKIEEVQKLELINQRLQYIADRDDLTKVYKRRYFEESLKKAFYLSKTVGAHYVLLYIDVNDFKSINDTFGHVVGDSVLIALSSALTNTFRSKDIVARLGGDEFVVLLEVEGDLTVEHYADHLIARINNICVEFEDKVIYPSVSIGATSIDKETKTLDDILMLADMACYKAKKRKALGGSHYVVS